MNDVIYMDHQATTPVDPRVVDRMLPYFTEKFGNSSSRSHAFGWQAEEAVEAARAHVAALLGAEPREVIFTSGATEANNLALFGVVEAHPHKDHIVTQATEHKAVLDVCHALEERGTRVTYLPVDRDGLVDPQAVADAIEPSTALVSIMHANNEVGTVQPLAEIGAICRAKGVLLHTDAAQSAGKIPLKVNELRVDLVSLSGHKLYAPKGVGALYVRRRDPRVNLRPQTFGGGQERGLRPGTLNVPGIVGLGEATRLAQVELPTEGPRLTDLRERLWQELRARVEGVELNGHRTQRLPGNLSVGFSGVDAETLLLAMPGVALSSGSACTSTNLEPSHVLLAMGRTPAQARAALRFGLGRGNTAAHIVEVVSLIDENSRKIKQLHART
ncbi:MAG: cysteine desulfurase family protein [Myxococcota bacterium]